MKHHGTILIVDFGSQYTQLITRRVRELGVFSVVLPPDAGRARFEGVSPCGVVLSGGPASVFEKGSPRLDPALLDLGVPVLGICYGMQALCQELGGAVRRGEEREYGRARIRVSEASGLLEGTPREQTVWMSHGDRVESLPEGFHTLASTAGVPVAAAGDPERGLYGLQFHPEVSQTEAGERILENFVLRVAGSPADWTPSAFIEERTDEIRARVGTDRVLCALSGGVDSSVMAALLDRAVGDRLVMVFVDNGLLREGEADEVMEGLGGHLSHEPLRVDAGDHFLSALEGVVDPEEKRRRIGHAFVEVFEEQSRALGPFRFLAQGTLYPDVIESRRRVGPSSTIKTHHNVGGLPERLGFELIEPLDLLFKDEVRRVGRELGLPERQIRRHPFPGPGLAVRVIGEVTRDRLDLLRRADRIFIDLLVRENLYDTTWQAGVVLLPIRTVGVMGDARTYENVVALRAVDSRDGMTADWTRLPHDFLQLVATTIVNRVPGINRVVYDISSKPPSTIEWE
jgi:GMP synthase (glutamine-hydrolysing)